MGLLVDYRCIRLKLNELLELIKKVGKEVEYLYQVVGDLGIFWDSEAAGEFAINIYGDLCNVELTIEALGIIVNSMQSKLFDMNDAEIRIKTIIEGI